MQKPSIGARAGSSSTRKQLEGFGSVGLPGSGRLDDKRYKAHTLGGAHLAGVQMRRFHSSILGCGRKGLLPVLRKGLLPLWGRDGQVKCSRAPSSSLLFFHRRRTPAAIAGAHDVQIRPVVLGLLPYVLLCCC